MKDTFVELTEVYSVSKVGRQLVGSYWTSSSHLIFWNYLVVSTAAKSQSRNAFKG